MNNFLCCIIAVVRDIVTQERHNVLLQRRNTITVCESPQVSPTSPENELQSLRREHESKLKRTGPVSKSNACPNDLRKRLNDKLHGHSSVSRLHSCRLHGSISEDPSETENSESIGVKKTESQSIRRVSSSRISPRSLIQNKNTDNTADSCTVKRSNHRVTHKNESDSPTQNSEHRKHRVQRKLSETGENSRPTQRTTSNRVRRPVSQKYSNESSISNETESTRPHSPKIMIPKRSSSPSSSSPTTPVKTHVSTSFAGLTEISSSPIKMHDKHMHENACTSDSEDSDISLGRSVPSRRVLVSRRSSMPVSKSCNDLGEETPSVVEPLQRTQSFLEIEPQRPRPRPRPRPSKRNSLTLTSTDSDNSPSEPQVQNLQNERLSSENSNPPKPVPRPRTKIVQRSKSQRPSVRQSTDLSQLSAINSSQNSILENGIGGGDETANQISVTSPRKTYRSETPDPSKLRSDSPAESQLSELDVNELLHVSLNTPCVQETDTNHSSTTPCQDSCSDSVST